MLLPSTWKGPQILLRNKKKRFFDVSKRPEDLFQSKEIVLMLLSQAQKRPPVFFQRKSFNIFPGTEGTAGSVTGWDVASADTR